MGHEVFSFGSYINPNTPHDPKRPPIKVPANEYLLNVALQCSQENLHEKLIDWADVIIIMHRPDWVISNWAKIKHKRVILRTIGQNNPDQEAQLSVPKAEGLQIVRYSPQEETIQNFSGQDALIRFYKDPKEFKGYNGENRQVITISQGMRERGDFCRYNVFEQATADVPRAIYGTQSKNADLSPMEDPLWKGQLQFSELKRAYRDNRVYFYTGTYPASYTLNFIEAFMTGIPVVAIGEELANLNIWNMHTYEVDKIIENGITGFTSNSIEELNTHVKRLLDDPELAKKIGKAGREKAIELFGKDNVRAAWEAFL